MMAATVITATTVKVATRATTAMVNGHHNPASMAMMTMTIMTVTISTKLTTPIMPTQLGTLAANNYSGHECFDG